MRGSWMPNNLVGLFLFVALLVPGYIYERRRARDVPAYERSVFGETLSIVFVSVLTDWVAVVVFALVAHAVPSAVPDLARLRHDPEYLTQNLLPVSSWSAGVLAFAVALAYGLAVLRKKDARAERSGWWW